MNPQKILQMDPGSLMDELITSIVHQVDNEIPHKSWSTDDLAALQLREYISDIGCSVSCTRFGGAPIAIQEHCSIQDDENESWSVETASPSMAESMSRAFLLFHNKFYGTHMNSSFEKKMSEAKRRPAKIYSFRKETQGTE
ncbi:hypothetical protein GZH47_32915 (plasmid) [Paenibacillus rhizovicinus]|uniref:Uncharacterized protein n=1 Tax=Paenibacillus rhizovicinus TaxID=2704463 RepID=A0A6C0PB80_9BACL|nr:hypothetical protein [Paenibacillus rhizovicinus]QHW35696.1 hypothetical protein GZH47_32915 [Paenibacillus rhizovicinus]